MSEAVECLVLGAVGGLALGIVVGHALFKRFSK